MSSCLSSSNDDMEEEGELDRYCFSFGANDTLSSFVSIFSNVVDNAVGL